MRSDRRSFLRVIASALALAFGAARGARSAAVGVRGANIHEASRNTRLGALGVRRPRLTAPPPVSKPYPGKRRIALPPPADEAALSLGAAIRGWETAGAVSAERLGLAALARLLFFTNGMTEVLPAGRRLAGRRAAPSAGASYAGEVYVVAERVEGLEPGIYSYSVAGNELVEVRKSSALGEVARCVEQPAALASAAAVILLTNVFERYSWRYAHRGYRYALIDSGHIGENLRLAARSAGLSQRAFLRFADDPLNDLLAVDGSSEAVCALHAVGGVLAADSSKNAGIPAPLAERQRTHPQPFAEDATPASYHSATKLAASGVSDASRRAIEERAPPTGGPSVALPPREPGPAMTVEAAIRVRRSAREFQSASLSRDQLGYVLEMAHGHDALSRSPGISLYVAAHRVIGLEAGLYRYQRSGHRLLFERSGSLADDMVRACLGQDKAGSAAAGLLMVAELGVEGEYARDRRYRDLLVESGAIGQRIYLAAEASGLAARNLAAFLDDRLNALLGLDVSHEAVVHLTMLGPGD